MCHHLPHTYPTAPPCAYRRQTPTPTATCPPPYPYTRNAHARTWACAFTVYFRRAQPVPTTPSRHHSPFSFPRFIPSAFSSSFTLNTFITPYYLAYMGHIPFSFYSFSSLYIYRHLRLPLLFPTPYTLISYILFVPPPPSLSTPVWRPLSGRFLRSFCAFYCCTQLSD